MKTYEMGKMDSVFGRITMHDDGHFTFTGDSSGFMEKWMRELEKRGLSGQDALTAFFRDFSMGTYWFNDVEETAPDPPDNS